MTGTAHIIRGDALALPLPDASVDLVVTSPPYFALRSYQDGGEHYAGQLGSEATPAEFVAALVAATREMVRVLKPSGSIWVNLGDKYAGSGGGGAGSSDGETGRGPRPSRFDVGIPTKSLMGIPWRYAIRCIDELGLILRAEVIWSKPNGLPESVTDRVRRSHETWFHFVKQPRYFSAVDEIRHGYEGDGRKRGVSPHTTAGHPNSGGHIGLNLNGNENPLGKLPGSVWTIPTEPLTVPDHLGVDHFAAYPTEWPRRIIAGWSPSGICVGCGEGRRPVTTAAVDPPMKPFRVAQAGTRQMGGVASSSLGHSASIHDRTITGYVCACTPHEFREESIWPGLCFDCYPDPYSPATHGADGLMLPPTEPAVVLDPFGGTGTTALVAKALGRTGISIDLSADYCRLATWRTNNPDQLAKASRVNKPPREADGQLGFDFDTPTEYNALTDMTRR